MEALAPEGFHDLVVPRTGRESEGGDLSFGGQFRHAYNYAAVDEHDPGDGQLVAHGHFHLHGIEAEGAVPQHGHHPFSRLRQGRGDGEAAPHAHGAPGAGVQPPAGQVVVDHAAGNVHGVVALADHQGIGGQGPLDFRQGPVVAHGRLAGFQPGRQFRLLGRHLLAQSTPPFPFWVALPGVFFQGGHHLPGGGLEIGGNGHPRRNVDPQFLRCQVDLDGLHPFSEAGGSAEVHDPVEAGAQQQDRIRILQRIRAGRGDAGRVGVRHHPLAHGRGQEGHPRAVDQAPDLVRGIGPHRALAHDGQGPLRRAQGFQGLRHQRGIGLGSGRGSNGGRVGQGFFLHLRIEDIRGEVQVHRPRAAVGSLAHGVLHQAGYLLHARGLPGPLAPGGGGRHLGRFLESPPGRVAQIGRSAQHQQGPAVGLGVAHGGDDIGQARPGDRQGAGDAPPQVAQPLGGEPRRLLVAHSIIGDVLLLDAEAQFHHGNSDHPEYFGDSLGPEGLRYDLATF